MLTADDGHALDGGGKPRLRMNLDRYFRGGE